ILRNDVAGEWLACGRIIDCPDDKSGISSRRWAAGGRGECSGIAGYVLTKKLREISLTHKGGRHCVKAGVLWLLLTEGLVVTEDKDLVLPEWTAGRAAELFPL